MAQHVESNALFADLMTFQDEFLSLAHTHIYKSAETSQNFLKFHISHLCEIEGKYKSVIAELNDKLVVNKLPYHETLRDHFGKLLNFDFLPLLHINRHDITKVSLWGFDIYIHPFEAVLQIIHRIDSIKYTLLQAKKQDALVQLKQTAQSALQSGWSEYLKYLRSWKLTFNLFMLKEYLQVAASSFTKDEKELIFTGCAKIFHTLAPSLMDDIPTLIELAHLNISLYSLHSSYDVFNFYTLLMPFSDAAEPVFRCLSTIALKCKDTCVITPLLVGLMRNLDQFQTFIEQIASQIWLPYLQILIHGLIINFKYRILEYEEVISICEAALSKASLLGPISLEEALKEHEPEWQEAQYFFNSTVKYAKYPGKVLTWKALEYSTIQPRMFQAILNNMLLNFEATPDSLRKYLPQLTDQLDVEVRVILQNPSASFQTLVSNLKPYGQEQISSEKLVCSLIRLVNTIRILKRSSQNITYFLLSAMRQVSEKINGLLEAKLIEAGQTVTSFVLELSRIGPSKDYLVLFHSRFRPKGNILQISQLYFNNLEPKVAITSLIELFSLKDHSPTGNINDFVVALCATCVNRPLKADFIVKTFQTEYVLGRDYFNLPHRTHSSIVTLTTLLLNGSSICAVILGKIVRACPQIGLSLLSFPVTVSDSLQSFSKWLIEHEDYHWLILSILSSSKGSILTKNGVDYMHEVHNVNICQEIVKVLNQHPAPALALKLIQLLLQIQCKFTKDVSSGSIYKGISRLSLFVLGKFEFESDPTIPIELIRCFLKSFSQLPEEEIQLWADLMIVGRTEGQQVPSQVTQPQLKYSKQNAFIIENTKRVSQELESYDIDQVRSRVETEKASVAESEGIPSMVWRVLDEKIAYQFRVKNAGKAHVLMAHELKQISIPALAPSFCSAMLADPKLLQFICLNPVNNQQCFERAITGNHLQVLKTMTFCSNLNLVHLLELGDKDLVLTLMSKLSSLERAKLAESLDLEAINLNLFMEFLTSLGFISVLNSANWRNLLTHFSNQFSARRVTSVLLQYEEYLLITGEASEDYEVRVKHYTDLLYMYSSILAERVAFIQQSSSQEERTLKTINEISSLKTVTSAADIDNVLNRAAQLHCKMKERNLSFPSTLLQACLKLNYTINSLLPGQIMLPDFSQGYSFTSQQVYVEHGIKVGVAIENYLAFTGITEVNRFVDFTKSESQLMALLSIKDSKQDPQKEYLQIVDSLKNLGVLNECEDEDGATLWTFSNEPAAQPQLYHVFKLGCLQARLTKPILRLSDLIVAILKRDRLSWSVLKQQSPEQYHEIKAIMGETDINSKQLAMKLEGCREAVWMDSSGLIKEHNRLEYVRQIGLQAMGENALSALKMFLKGYCLSQIQ